MSLEPDPKILLLKDRAYMLAQARLFFSQKGVVEIDAPILNRASNIDDYIDPITASYCNDQEGFLHTSPELFLKKILALGSGDIYFLGHVFRDHEKGEHHHIEFTMVEWYRLKLSYQEMIDETLEFVKLFVSETTARIATYEEMLLKYTGLNVFEVNQQSLCEYAQVNLNVSEKLLAGSRNDLLTLIFTEMVEPHFKELGLIAIKDYPAEQAALAKVREVKGQKVASRFEVYYQGVELANGYDELIGSTELEKRFNEHNEKRQLRGKKKLPIDREFIKANGLLPQCTGVAVGFDRLMMLRHQLDAIFPIMART